jgi:basic membrane protein A
MAQRWQARISTAFALACVGLACASCSGSDKSVSGGPDGSGIDAALVTDVGGAGDRAYNELASAGLERAEAELKVDGTIVESKRADDYPGNVANAAKKSDVTIGVGYLLAEAVTESAGTKPNGRFVLIDYDYATAGDSIPANVRSIVFREDQAGYLAGAFAAMVEEDSSLRGLNAGRTISIVGGRRIPQVQRYVAGFRAGIREYCKECKLILGFSNTFTDRDACERIARSQIAQGSDIVFQVAGACGLGALKAARSAGVWGIGSDADQSYLGPHMLTSALKRIDVATYDAVRSVVDGTYDGGSKVTYGAAEDGVALGRVAPAAAEWEQRMAPVYDDLRAGRVNIPVIALGG